MLQDDTRFTFAVIVVESTLHVVARVLTLSNDKRARFAAKERETKGESGKGNRQKADRSIFDEHSSDDRPIETTIPQEDSIVNYLLRINLYRIDILLQ